ncbi:discoidin domain-containing protein, partial [Aquipuribacter sp. SD81]|uniref:discoidin domain-containing protein n=1 Tax=Aquipuribacter sp. SD81 TaxID=3127703 RepID=UPI00301B1A49
PGAPGGRGPSGVRPTGSRPPRRRPAGAGAGVAVVLVMGAVVVGALVYGLDRLRDPTVAAPQPTVTQTVQPSAAEPSPEPSEPAPSEPEPSGPVEPEFVSPAGVQPLDPLGDGEENDQEAPRAIDGDPSSAWTTQRYNSQAFGGLKDGLGLAFDLGEPRLVSGVSVVAPGSDGALEVRTAPDASYDGSEVVGTLGTGGGEQVVELDEPVEAQFVVLWFTSLPENEGDWRALVSEVQVQVAP